MSNISVTTQQNIIDVTDTSGITVTTPEGQTINVSVPNSSVNVTNTTDEITVLTAGTLNIQTGGIVSVNGETGPVVVLDTDDVGEGSTNQYFTQARARQSISAGSGISYNSSTGVITSTATGSITSVNGQTGPTVVLDTDDISEGSTNLYYTTARANTDFDTRFATKSTTNLAEGTNLYYTDARFDTRLATKTTDNLNEGTTNQYFTTTRARQAISAVDTGGDGSLSYDNSTGVITYTGPTASEVRAHFTAGTGVTITDGSIAIGQDVATTANPIFAGGTFGNISIGVDTDNTIASTDTNGNIILDPNGTGDVVMTFADGGNLTNNRNYVMGAIRNSSTDSLGDIWAVNTTGTFAPFRGVNLDNSTDTTRGPATVLRSFSGGAVSGAATRGRVVFEKARGTAASPTAVQVGDFFGSVDATGYTSTGWLNDTVSVTPAFYGFTAQENWVSNTNLGTGFALSLAPTATTISTGANLITCMSVSPQAFASRSDAFTWANGKTGTTQTMALDVSGNLTVTGDLTVTGNDIKASGGATAMTMVPITANNPNTDFTGNIVKGAIRTGAGEANGNIYEFIGGAGPSTGISIDNTDKVADRTSLVIRNYGGSLTAGAPRPNIIMESARGTAGTPLNLNNGDNLLELQASGYTSTGWLADQVNAPPAILRFRAAEPFNNGLNNVGTSFQVLTQPTATTLSAGGASLVLSFSNNPQSTNITSDSIIFNNKSSPTLGGNASFIGGNTSITQYFSPFSSVFSPGFKYSGLIDSTTLTNDGSTFEMSSRWKASSGSSTFVIPQNNWGLGQFNFSADNTTTNTNQITAGGFKARATENWSSTATGSSMTIYANRAGVVNTSVNVAVLGPDSSAISSDIITLESSTGTDYATLDNTSATFTRPVGFPVYTAAAAGALTGAVGQQICISDSAQGSNPNGMMAFWDTSNTRWSYIHDNSAV